MNRLKSIYFLCALFCISISLSSCEAIAGIFKAGVWTGILIVALVIGLIIFLASRGKK